MHQKNPHSNDETPAETVEHNSEEHVGLGQNGVRLLTTTATAVGYP